MCTHTPAESCYTREEMPNGRVSIKRRETHAIFFFYASLHAWRNSNERLRTERIRGGRETDWMRRLDDCRGRDRDAKPFVWYRNDTGSSLGRQAEGCCPAAGPFHAATVTVRRGRFKYKSVTNCTQISLYRLHRTDDNISPASFR